MTYTRRLWFILAVIFFASFAAQVFFEQVDAAELAPGEFAQRVRTCVEEHGARTVIVDSLNGYQAAMPEERQLILHMHELLQFLNRQGATTFLTVAQHGLVGDMKAPVDVTYLADTVILLRYFEAAGRVRRHGERLDLVGLHALGADADEVDERLALKAGVLRSSNPAFCGVQIRRSAALKSGVLSSNPAFWA